MSTVSSFLVTGDLSVVDLTTAEVGIYSERRDILQSAIKRFCSRDLEVVGIGAGLHLAALLNGSMSATALIDRAQAAGIRLHALQKFAAAGHKAEGLVFGYGAVESQQIGEGMRQLARLM